MAVSDPDKTPVRGTPSLDENSADAELEDSGLRARSSFDAALAMANRAALDLALATGDCVSIVVRGDPARGVAMRTVEGVVVRIGSLQDGRERVRVAVHDGVEQLVLVERIMRVSPSR